MPSDCGGGVHCLWKLFIAVAKEEEEEEEEEEDEGLELVG